MITLGVHTVDFQWQKNTKRWSKSKAKGGKELIID
jgi:hypothetical protein